MATTEIHRALARLFTELADGATEVGDSQILNSGDIGLLRSLDTLTAADASRAVNDGATIAAHAQHVRFGLSLLNRWAIDGGDPFADARWDDAWKLSTVDVPQWEEIRRGLAEEARRWRKTLEVSRPLTPIELAGMIGSIAHLAYHLGAIRQIAKSTRGPKEGTFV